jgi:hypothetical protein
MPAGPLWLWFLLAALATWRVTHLIVREDGPWNVIARIRRRAGSGFWGELMDCFYCSSLWVSAIFAFTLRPNLEQWIVYWLALSGLACLLERIGQSPVIVHSAASETQGGTEHAVLRTESGASEDGSSNEGNAPGSN